MNRIVLMIISATAVFAQDFRIAGTLVNAVTGRPIGGAHVTIALEGQRTNRAVLTGVDGRFSFAELPAASWTLAAERPGFVRQIYGSRPGIGTLGSAVITGAGNETGRLTFRLYPPAVVRGTVADEDGEPVENAWVQLLASAIVNGRRRVFPYTSAWSDDLGRYRFGSLPAGTYYVAVTGHPWYPTYMLPQREETRLDKNTYEPQFYRNASDARSASPLTVKPGAEAVVDFSLRRGHGVTVTVLGAPRDVRLELASAGIGESRIGHQPEFTGLAAFGGVLPGHYWIQSGDSMRETSSMQEIDVGASNMEVRYAMPDLVDVTATTRAAAADAEALGRTMIVLENRGNDAQSRMASPNAPVYFGRMAPGRYQLTVWGRDQLYVKSLSAEGASVSGTSIDIPGRGPVRLDLVLGGDGGRVRGHTYVDDKPCEAIMVILVPHDVSRDAVGYQTESDGSFDYKCVKPGDYTIFATADFDLEWANRDAIRKHVAAGQSLRVEPNSKHDLRLAPVAP